ncbi:uncharacterized protein BDW70DRAFT_145822 [Aspergillus foveolatus]|uniref:uncharacterized protein n=1 Tax=Aspergillus foveolatus TaxID=210207 RepID=UPI003CCCCF78
MRSQTMASNTEQVASPHEPTNCAFVEKNTSCESCIISRLSKWLWSCRTTQPPLVEENARPVEDESSKNPFPCRACRASKVICDRQTPRCGHCLDQQILCFYVEPLRITMKRAKQARQLEARSESVTSCS